MQATETMKDTQPGQLTGQNQVIGTILAKTGRSFLVPMVLSIFCGDIFQTLFSSAVNADAVAIAGMSTGAVALLVILYFGLKDDEPNLLKANTISSVLLGFLAGMI